MRSLVVRTVSAATLVAGTVVTVIVGTPPAGAVGTRMLDATYTSVANGWAKVERWHDTDTNLPQEAYPPDGRGNQDGQRLTFFGNVAQPRSNTFLLYYAPHWQTGTKATPVLLVHGANDNADRAWANPGEAGGFGCGDPLGNCPSTGLMQYLDARGYKVFAISFPHKQGDNYYQAQLVADAIAVIKSDLGVSKVDLIGWSKGGFPARMYVSSVKPSWGLAYQGDVRKLILIGNANKGIDWSWAHGIAGDTSVWPECGGSLNAPAAVTSFMCYGVMYSHPELSFTGTGSNNTYPGQRQMLARWDGTYGVDQSQQDWYTVYYGGTGYTSVSPGIQSAINQGSLVDTIRAAGIPSTVTTYLLCGGTANIPGVYNENRGPSDGLLFNASCQDTGGIGTVGGVTTVTSDNHLELAWESTAVAQIASWLG
jgi:pimeloyl-ACP methyl ester carboxylesterase